MEEFPIEHASCVMPSAPPCEDVDKHVKYIPPELSVCHMNQVEFELREKESHSKDINVHPKILSGDSKDSRGYEANTDAKNVDVKICQGQISPNSSFGFIPHLQDDKSDDKKKLLNSENVDHNEKSMNKLEEFKKQFSKAFTELSEELDSAETRLNECLKGKELSDIIQGKDGKESSTEVSFIQTVDEENNTVNEEVKPVERNVYSNEATLQGRAGDYCSSEERISEDYEQISKSDYMRYYEKFKNSNMWHKEYNGEEGNNCSGDEEVCHPDNDILETNEDYQEFEEADKSEAPNFVRNEELKPSSSQNNTDKEENKVNSEYRKTIDEDWRRRWYEVHPRLDSENYFRQRVPVVHRGRRFNFSTNYRDRRIPNIGEGGDVPLERRFYRDQEEMSGRFECRSDSNLDGNSAVSPLDAESANLYNRFSASDKPEGISTRDFNTRRGSISSQSIPYSWRQMSCKQLEHQKSQFSKDQLKREDIPDNIECPELSPEMSSATNPESESLQEVVTGKETEDEGETDSCRKRKIMPNSGKEDAKFGEVQTLPNEKNSQFPTTIEEKLSHNSLNNQDLDNMRHKQWNSIVSENFSTGDFSQVTQNNQNFGSEPEHFFDAYGQYAEFSGESHPKVYSDEELSCGKDYDSENANEEFLNCINKGNEEDKFNVTNNYCIPLETTEDRNVCQTSAGSEKIEPGLNSACGDFIPSNNTENSNCTTDVYSGTVSSEISNSSLNLQNHRAGTSQEINAEYFEGVMRRDLEQQNDSLNDDYEVLNFSSYSMSDSSDLEESSDISEADNTT